MSSLKETEGILHYNYFKYAKSELAHSAFWAWVFQSLDSKADELVAPRNLAKKFLTKIEFQDLAFPIKVSTEYCLENNKKDRFDIYVKDNNGRILVIENKVDAIPYTEQPRRYEEALKKDGKKNFKVVVLSISFDLDVRQELVRGYVGLEDIIEMMDGEVTNHPLIRDYETFVKTRLFERKRILRAIETGNEQDFKNELPTAEGQWLLMDLLTKGMAGQPPYPYSGQNIGGSRWTQFCFCSESSDKPKFDSLFYRIDFSSQGPYFAVRQYNSSPDELKKARLNNLRSLWKEVCGEYKSLVSENPRNGGDKEKESEIGWFLLSKKENNPTALQEALPNIHKKFIEKLRKEGWPVI